MDYSRISCSCPATVFSLFEQYRLKQTVAYPTKRKIAQTQKSVLLIEIFYWFNPVSFFQDVTTYKLQINFQHLAYFHSLQFPVADTDTDQPQRRKAHCCGHFTNLPEFAFG